jgi:cytochrome c556
MIRLRGIKEDIVKFGQNIIIGMALMLAPAVLLAAVSDTIQSRQRNYKKIGASFKGLNDELRKQFPSIAVIRTHANNLNKGALAVTNAFPKGSGQGSGVKTGAHPEIWLKPQAFKTAHGKLLTASRGLNAASNGNDLGKIRSAMTKVGPTCKACHDQFRIKD